VLVATPGKPISVAALSLANASAGDPDALSGMLVAAASQSTFATEICGVFISSAGAALAMNNARPTRTVRLNSASLVLPRQPKGSVTFRVAS